MKIFDKIMFLFSFPKYKIYQRVWIWDSCYMIISIKRDWKFETYSYELLGCSIDITEGVIDFYQEKEKLDNNQ